MSEAATATRTPPAHEAVPGTGQNRVSELKASAHLMSLDTGLFCVFQANGTPSANAQSGLPGVRITLPPGAGGRSDAVSISTFQADGWISGQDTAALVRVTKGPAHVLVTVYQAPAASPDSAPRLQVMRLGGGEPAARPPASAVRSGQATALSAEADVVAHIQRTGDVPAKFGEWIGTRGSQSWIEGFSLTPHDGIKPADVEYQAVLGRGWLSPWIEGGKFCGSRGMALPLLGLKVRLKGAAANTHECSYAATFVDGSSVGPVPAGEICESESLAALESFQVMIRRSGAAADAAPRAGSARAVASAGKPAVARPAVPKPARGTAKSPRPRQ
jgi:hypothetical protein